MDINATLTFDSDCVDQVWSYDGTWRSHESLLEKGRGFWIKSNQKCNLPAYTEPLQSKQWSIFDTAVGINLKNYYGKYTGKGVKIAIIDDSIDIFHEDLPHMDTYNVTDIESFYHHGTSVTGIISAQINNKGIVGIAPDAEILFIMMESSNTVAQYLDMFDYAQNWGADIINCSWGTYDVSKSVKEKIISMNIPIVFAAGNDNKDIEYDESGIYEVISVGASTMYDKRMVYSINQASNYGENIDLVAPGVNIVTTKPNNQYMEDFTGTSASAPIVTSIIALMLEANPSLSREDIEMILQSTADKIGDIEYDERGHNIYYGYGKINADKALKMAENFVSTKSALKSINNNVVKYKSSKKIYEDLNKTTKVDFR